MWDPLNYIGPVLIVGAKLSLAPCLDLSWNIQAHKIFLIHPMLCMSGMEILSRYSPAELIHRIPCLGNPSSKGGSVYLSRSIAQ